MKLENPVSEELDCLQLVQIEYDESLKLCPAHQHY
jgi:hypothetical protein